MACSIDSFNLICPAHTKEFFKILFRRKLHHLDEFSGIVNPVSSGLFTGADTAADQRRTAVQIKFLLLFFSKRIIHFLPQTARC